ncbi:Cytochrome c-552 [Dyella sp. AD56]|nr:Cytochrome c-552 [Dyella sp. AD56]
MDADYLAHTLTAFKIGTRSSDTMQPIASALSDTDISALANYFAAQRPPPAHSQQLPAATSVAGGNLIALQGGSKGAPACFSCHGTGGHGQGERYPRIASEPATYIVNRLHEFQERARHGTPKSGSMTEVASRLTDSEVRDVAAYLSMLPPE